MKIFIQEPGIFRCEIDTEFGKLKAGWGRSPHEAEARARNDYEAGLFYPVISDELIEAISRHIIKYYGDRRARFVKPYPSAYFKVLV